MTVKRNNAKRRVGVTTNATAADTGGTSTEFQLDSSNQSTFHHASIISNLALEHTTRYQCNNTRDDDKCCKNNHLLIYCSPPSPTYNKKSVIPSVCWIE